MSPQTPVSPRLYLPDSMSWTLIGIVCILFGFIYTDAFLRLNEIWSTHEEMSYGYMVPFISAFLFWQKRDLVVAERYQGSWLGIAIIAVGLLLNVIGELTTLFLVIQYSFVITLIGVALSILGTAGFRHVWAAFVILFFMVPLPAFLLLELSAQLQLISSELGVAVIRLFGISVFLEGNVIDLGQMKLQVVEACSGLRYLFPLMTLGFIAAYFYRAAMWKRWFVFLSTIPITVLMNSFRIGMIGVLVEYGGKSQAEGFLHDFEGWVIFMTCTGILLVEMWLLSGVGEKRRPLREVFGLDLPPPLPKDAEVQRTSPSRPAMVGTALVLLTAVTTYALPARVENSPTRQAFRDFPLEIGGWRGTKAEIEKIYLDELKLNDYILADYAKSGELPINFYVAWYDSQRKGESAHSPRTCIPGGGWKIVSLESYPVNGVAFAGRPLTVNRTVIQMGEVRQLVYYWFQERGRSITNEYVVKWYILWDALTRNRTDGGLVRLTTTVRPGENIADADGRLAGFLKLVNEPLKAYLPD